MKRSSFSPVPEVGRTPVGAERPRSASPNTRPVPLGTNPTPRIRRTSIQPGIWLCFAKPRLDQERTAIRGLNCTNKPNTVDASHMFPTGNWLRFAQRSSSIRGTIATHFDGSSWKFMGGLGSAELSNPEAAEFTTGGLKAVLLFPWLALLWPGMPGQSSFKVSSRFAILDLLGFPAGTTRRPR